MNMCLQWIRAKYVIWILNTAITNAFRNSQRDLFYEKDNRDITKKLKNFWERIDF